MCANSCWYLYNFRKNTIQTLIGNGHEVACIAPPDQYSMKLSRLGCTTLPLKLSANGVNPIQELKSICQLRKILKDFQPAVLLTFNPKLNIYGGLTAKSLRINQIANISGMGTLNNSHPLKKTLYYGLYKIALKTANHIFFQNERDQDTLCRRNVVDKSRTSRLMGSGVDLQRFTYRPLPPPNPINFVFIGRLIEEKGVRKYVEASIRLKKKYGDKVRFSIVGIIESSTNKRAITKEELKAWNDNSGIVYCGHSDHIAEILTHEHIVVLPSTYSEGVPKVALEGAAAGRIVITSNISGCRETLVNGVTGFHCDPHSIDSIVNAMERPINMTIPAMQKMGLAARKRTRQLFDERNNIEAYLEKIHTLTGITHSRAD